VRANIEPAVRDTYDKLMIENAELFEDTGLKVESEEKTLSVAWMLNRHPLLGGDYYRAYRPAHLSSAHFGWVTSVANRMVEDGGRLGFVTPSEEPHVLFSDVLIIRPVEGWHKEFTDQAHENGQVVIADVDDDLWGHEDLLATGKELSEFSSYDEWFPYVDGALVSTKYLAAKIRAMDYGFPVWYAPNCYDPTSFAASPKPSRRLGTRMWLSGRSDGEVKMYDEWIYPLLDKLDLSFTHIGAMESVDESEAVPGAKARRSFGWDTPRLIERPSMVLPEMAGEFERFSIGTIMMVDNEYNRSKTDTHAAELGLAGLPLVSASAHELYRNIPGTVTPTADAVERRVRELLNPETWWIESKRTLAWARARAIANESLYLGSLLAAVNHLTK
jgi:hypothetical protein